MIKLKRILRVLYKDITRIYNNLFKAEVFIYQMGKVGSSTLFNSIKNSAQFHNYDKDAPQKYFAKSKIGIYRSIRWKAFYWSTKIRIKYLEKKGKKIKIISMARDPVARNISAFFQVLEKGKKYKTDKLINDFFNKTYHEVPLNWFDIELKRHFGIDIYKYKFPKEKGFYIIKYKNIELLLLKLEMFNQCLNDIKNFIGEDFEIKNENISEKKWYSDMYKDFKKEIIFPKEYLEKMYRSKFTNHFYTEEEINRFYSKWTKH